MESRVCELCRADASLYCDSDSAFLCFRCDADVHGANFLVARHVRHPVCSSCRSLADERFSGARITPRPTFCRSCSGESVRTGVEDFVSLSSGSDCVSSTGSAAAAAPTKIRSARRREMLERFSSSSLLTETSAKGSTRFPSREVSSSSTRIGRGRNRAAARSSLVVSRVDPRAEGILGIWGQRMGLSESSVVDRAARALGSCDGEMTALPLRLLLAASFWLGLRMCRERSNATWQAQIRKLEEVSGVPAKLIAAAASKLARASGARRAGLEEGCGECSV